MLCLCLLQQATVDGTVQGQILVPPLGSLVFFRPVKTGHHVFFRIARKPLGMPLVAKRPWHSSNAIPIDNAMELASLTRKSGG
ncbi:hypothetical protein BDW75DRAFT_208330 [Aspergillus navahoensis]